MSYTIEFRLPSKTPYAYVNIGLTAVSGEQLGGELNEIVSRMADITRAHNEMMRIHKDAPPEAKALIESELGGKVIETTDLKPWERKQDAPTTPVWQEPKPPVPSLDKPRRKASAPVNLF